LVCALAVARGELYKEKNGPPAHSIIDSTGEESREGTGEQKEKKKEKKKKEKKKIKNAVVSLELLGEIR